MVKTYQILLQNQLANGLKTWYVASSMEVLPRLFKGWPWVYFDLFLQQGKIWENSRTSDFMKSFEDFGLKMVCTVVLMSTSRFVRTRGQGYTLPYFANIKTSPQKPRGRLWPDFIKSLGLQGLREWKCIQTVLVTELLLQKQLTNGLETYYVASSTQVLGNYYKNVQMMT